MKYVLRLYFTHHCVHNVHNHSSSVLPKEDDVHIDLSRRVRVMSDQQHYRGNPEKSVVADVEAGTLGWFPLFFVTKAEVTELDTWVIDWIK